ncbi:MAG: potassium/proton antiporter [Bacteroidales bacterium]|jgi:cell volume regulation protein A|nr:potassium/proton antiporter [Bacteroidales bacterium]MDD3272429.1 potassium/proton antiporter [Bacteroidales bacterium]MDD4057585.1 potassium/proton antiporter [Bacteroidales bacterium]
MKEIGLIKAGLFFIIFAYMQLTAENILLIGSVLIFVSVLAGKAAYKFGVPLLLLFLAVGMIFGSDGIGIKFDSPYIAQFIGNVALSVILFSGGLDTKFKDIRPVLAPGILMSTLGVLLTTLFTGMLIYLITSLLTGFPGLSIAESMLLASVMSSTDSASVFSILRSKGIVLKQTLKPLLELESGSNDPMAYMLMLIFLKMVITGNSTASSFITSFLIQFSVGALCGYGFAKLTLFFIKRLNTDNKSLYHILLLASLFFTQSATGLIGGNGFLAVYIAGLVIGNNKIQCDPTAYTFFDSVAWLSQLVLFLTLGLFVNPNELLTIAIPGILIAISLTFISRPFAVFITLSPFRNLSVKAKHFIAWIGLRGAVPIVFATYPLIAGIKNGQLMFDIVFFVTIVSLLLQGTSVSMAARKLSLSQDVEKSLNS